MPRFDITAYSYDEFASFLSDKEVQAEGVRLWYWDTEVIFDEGQLDRYYSRMLSEPRFLFDRFSRTQLDQGFWAIQSENLDCSLVRLIWNKRLSFDVRAELIRSMFDLFEKLFYSEPLDTAVYMWWDSFCYDWHCGVRKRERGGEDLEIQDVMFKTLSRIISLQSQTCQLAALHGLSHLRHPGTEALIERFLDQHALMSQELKDVAVLAAKFKLQ